MRPRPLPNHWVTGSTIGLSVDAQDRVWTIHRPNTVEDNFKAADITVGDERGRDPEALPGKPGDQMPAGTPIGACCKVAPPVLVYDKAGKLVKSWGGPGKGYDWPDSNHGITVDHDGNVWLAGNGDQDTQVLKFSGAGQFLFQIGKHGVHNGSNDIENFWKPTKVFVDPSADEAYVGDGYGNRRVIVFDAASGQYKRHWGAYGARPSDDAVPPPTIRTGRALGSSTRSAAPSSRSLMATRSGRGLEVLTSFGDGGRAPGQFFGIHNLATDSQGNLYTAETYTGARVQRFMYKGLGPVTKVNQGVVWPKGR